MWTEGSQHCYLLKYIGYYGKIEGTCNESLAIIQLL
jgi:hypothetical protein